MRPATSHLFEGLVVAAILTTAGTVVAISSRGSNCGGNNAALAEVRLCSQLMGDIRGRTADHRFSLDASTMEERESLTRIARDSLVHQARFLVDMRADRVPRDGSPRVVFVCDRPFRNVPRRFLGALPPTHAAAFSDGRCALISAAEFAALDRSSLTPLDEILAALSHGSSDTASPWRPK